MEDNFRNLFFADVDLILEIKGHKLILFISVYIYIYIYTAICKNFEPSRIYIDISLYLGVHLFLGAIFRKRCFPCDISMELPSRCESCMLSHISHLTETHQNCFYICIHSGRFKIFANCCIHISLYTYIHTYIHTYNCR